MGLAAPAVEQNTFFERLASGRNYEGVILAHSVRLRLGPVEFERLQLKRIQTNEKLGRVLETESSFSPSQLDVQVLEAGQPRGDPDHMPLASEFHSGRDRAIGHSLGVIHANGRGERLDSDYQFRVISRGRNEQVFTRGWEKGE